jgi:hypothetical protein
MGQAGAGKTALVAALAGELLWRDEEVVLIDAAASSENSLSRWIEAGQPGVFEGVRLVRAKAHDIDCVLESALSGGGTALIDVGHDDSLETAAAFCRVARMTLYVRWRTNDDGPTEVTAARLRALRDRRSLTVVYNGLTRGDSLRALRTECMKSGLGSFPAALSDRVAYRVGRYTGKPPAFQSVGSRIASREVARLLDDIHRYFEHLAIMDRLQEEQSRWRPSGDPRIIG